MDARAHIRHRFISWNTHLQTAARSGNWRQLLGRGQIYDLQLTSTASDRLTMYLLEPFARLVYYYPVGCGLLSDIPQSPIYLSHKSDLMCHGLVWVNYRADCVPMLTVCCTGRDGPCPSWAQSSAHLLATIRPFSWRRPSGMESRYI